MTDDERLNKAEQALNAHGVSYPRPPVSVVFRICRDRNYSAEEISATSELLGKSRAQSQPRPQINWCGAVFGSVPRDSICVVRDEDECSQNPRATRREMVETNGGLARIDAVPISSVFEI